LWEKSQQAPAGAAKLYLMRRSLWLALAWPGLTLGIAMAADPPAAEKRPDLNRVLPRWLRFKGEYRARWEGNSGIRFVHDADDHYLLTRVRLGFTIQPANWISGDIQVHDARVTGNTLFPTTPGFKDDLDVRLASIELKSELKRGDQLRLRLGRQELSLGDQRILGPSNWGNSSRSFDAVRFDWSGGPFDVQAFAASVVANRIGEVNRHIEGDNIHGLILTAGVLPRKGSVELQNLWRVAPRVLSESGTAGKLDIKTFVVRAVGDFNSRTHYVTEMAAQIGSRSNDNARAWAGHWRVLRDLSASGWKPAIMGVYDYATGDKRPGDGRSGTFDVLYPTPHDKYGLADQVGWKNIHHAEVRFQLAPVKNWRFEIKQLAWWLASSTDWLYSSSGAPVARDITGSSGRYVGTETDLQAFWVPSKQISLGMGVGRIKPGGFLKKTTPGAVLTFPYVMLTYAF
jgi:hypothetical protein